MKILFFLGIVSAHRLSWLDLSDESAIALSSGIDQKNQEDTAIFASIDEKMKLIEKS